MVTKFLPLLLLPLFPFPSLFSFSSCFSFFIFLFIVFFINSINLVFFKVFCLLAWQEFLGWGGKMWNMPPASGTRSLTGRENLYIWRICIHTYVNVHHILYMGVYICDIHFYALVCTHIHTQRRGLPQGWMKQGQKTVILRDVPYQRIRAR